MPKYEIMYLFSPQISEKEAAEKITQTNNIIKELGGEIEKEEYWGLKDLAYKIEHFKQGYYHITWFKLNKNQVDSLDKKLKSVTHLLRFLITTVTEEKETVVQREEKGKIIEQVEPALPKAEAKKSVSLPQEEASSEKKKISKTSKEPKAEMEDLDKKLEEILKEEVL